jgi:putative transposase
MMIKGIKVMLVPSNKQNTKLFQFSGTARFIYNWTLSRQQENYKNGDINRGFECKWNDEK